MCNPRTARRALGAASRERRYGTTRLIRESMCRSPGVGVTRALLRSSWSDTCTSARPWIRDESSRASAGRCRRAPATRSSRIGAAPAGALRVCRGTSCRLASAILVPAEGSSLAACRARSTARATATARPSCCAPTAWPSRSARSDRAARRSSSVAARDPIARARARSSPSGSRAASTTAWRRARAAGVWSALERAVRGEPESVLRALEASGERGRGGGGFPTGAKWRCAAQARGPEKYAIANGDEGDPGSFVDRVLLESDPHAVLEGLALCAFAIGARHGIVYVRSEYPRAATRVDERDRRGARGGPSRRADPRQRLRTSTCASRSARAATSAARRRR